MLNIPKKRNLFRLIIHAYPAFFVYTKIASLSTALGPVYIGSVVDQLENWEVEIIDENNFSLYQKGKYSKGIDHEYLQEERPANIVGFYGGMTSTVPRLYHLARFYRKKRAVTIAGGQHFVDENISEALQNQIDYVVIGEGEITIKELVKAIENGTDVRKVNGIAFRENGRVLHTLPREPITDFNRLPLPDFSLLPYSKIKLYPVEHVRGCGMACEFCAVKGKPRPASPELFLDRIRQLVETRNARHFFVVDDLFGQYRKEAIEICSALHDYQKRIKLRLDLNVQIRLDKAKDTELLSAMRHAGINMVAIGYESPIPEELKAMNKRIDPDEMLAFTRVFHRYGFLVHGMFIFGYPSDKITELKTDVRERIKIYKSFIKKSRIDTIQILNPIPLPGTLLRKRLEEKKRIYPLDKVGWEYYDGNFPVIIPDQNNEKDIQYAPIHIMSSFYRFNNVFKIILSIMLFPGLIIFLANIKTGWRKWYRLWRNCLIRFNGWLIINHWKTSFHKTIYLRRKTPV